MAERSVAACGHSLAFSSGAFVQRLPELVQLELVHAPGCGMCAVESALLSDDGALASAARGFLARAERKRHVALLQGARDRAAARAASTAPTRIPDPS